MILDKIVERTRTRLEALKAEKSFEKIKADALSTVSPAPFAFENALKGSGISFICEVKKASPSKGVIAEHFPYVQIAREYESAGASAISVLTEPYFFLGDDRYLKEIRSAVGIPLLRKDFTLDPYQIYQARLLGADAVLLICALLHTEQLRAYIKLADELGLSCLVEVHDEAELASALAADARVIGVNNRDLRTFEVDVNNSTRLRKLVPQNKIFVSESGIKTREDIAVLHENGTNAVLIGETLMRSGNIAREILRLKGDL